MKELIEKLEDLATYFTLAASNADKERKNASISWNSRVVSFWKGKKEAYEAAFKKIDKIIKEVIKE